MTDFKAIRDEVKKRLMRMSVEQLIKAIFEDDEVAEWVADSAGVDVENIKYEAMLDEQAELDSNLKDYQAEQAELRNDYYKDKIIQIWR